MRGSHRAREWQASCSSHRMAGKILESPVGTVLRASLFCWPAPILYSGNNGHLGSLPFVPLRDLERRCGCFPARPRKPGEIQRRPAVPPSVAGDSRGRLVTGREFATGRSQERRPEAGTGFFFSERPPCSGPGLGSGELKTEDDKVHGSKDRRTHFSKGNGANCLKERGNLKRPGPQTFYAVIRCMSFLKRLGGRPRRPVGEPMPLMCHAREIWTMRASTGKGIFRRAGCGGRGSIRCPLVFVGK